MDSFKQIRSVAMIDKSVIEEALKLKYPIGTKGKLSPIDPQTLTHLISRGWKPSFVATVEAAYVTGCDNISFLVVRWGQGQDDWSVVMTEGFEAIAMGSERTGIDKWYEEGCRAALEGENESQCPYDDDYHSLEEYIWWNRGYKFVDRSARLIKAERLIEETKCARSES